MPDKPEPVSLTYRLRDTLIDYALSQPEREVCALVGGSGRLLVSFYPVRNIATDPARRFLMDPAGQVDAIRRMDQRREQLCGVFHTHPCTPARPSPVDLKLAVYPGVTYLIASLAGPEPELQAFYYQGSSYTPAGINLVPDESREESGNS